jgi:hypothetical protein
MKTMTTPIEDNDNAANKAAATTLLLQAANDLRQSSQDEKMIAKRGIISEKGNENLAKKKDQTNKFSRKRKE